MRRFLLALTLLFPSVRSSICPATSPTIPVKFYQVEKIKNFPAPYSQALQYLQTKEPNAGFWCDMASAAYQQFLMQLVSTDSYAPFKHFDALLKSSKIVVLENVVRAEYCAFKTEKSDQISVLVNRFLNLTSWNYYYHFSLPLDAAKNIIDFVEDAIVDIKRKSEMRPNPSVTTPLLVEGILMTSCMAMDVLLVIIPLVHNHDPAALSEALDYQRSVLVASSKALVTVLNAKAEKPPVQVLEKARSLPLTSDQWSLELLEKLAAIKGSNENIKGVLETEKTTNKHVNVIKYQQPTNKYHFMRAFICRKGAAIPSPLMAIATERISAPQNYYGLMNVWSHLNSISHYLVQLLQIMIHERSVGRGMPINAERTLAATLSKFAGEEYDVGGVRFRLLKGAIVAGVMELVKKCRTLLALNAVVQFPGFDNRSDIAGFFAHAFTELEYFKRVYGRGSMAYCVSWQYVAKMYSYLDMFHVPTGIVTHEFVRKML